MSLNFFEMRFDLGTLDSGERSLPFGLLVHGPVISLLLFFALKNIFVLLGKPDSGELRCPATAVIGEMVTLTPYLYGIVKSALLHMSQAMRKCVLCHMRTTKAQISLRICAV